MNITTYAFALFALLISFNSAAETITDAQPMIRVIEMERMIINWSPSNQNLGRVMTYTCGDCPAAIMTIDLDATLNIAGEPQPIQALASKVDWAGTVTVTDKAPNNILSFSIY
jgi:hypothetical protein